MNGPPLDRQGALDWLAQQRVGTVDIERWIEESDLRAAALNGLTSLNQVRRVLDDLKQALADGKEFSEWREAYQFDMPASRLDLIVRNHVQAATVAGRFEAALASGDYLMFVTTKDDRVTTPCRIRDGMIRHSTDPSWQGSIPPLHANSFHPQQEVSGQAYLGLKARYSGVMVEAVGKSGGRFTVTANHPVLTTDGWMNANDLGEGVQLLCYRGKVDNCSAATSANKNNPPSKIEQVFDTLSLRGRASIPSAALDLNGDEVFLQGDVDIVSADGQLVDRIQAEFFQTIQQLLLVLSLQKHPILSSLRQKLGIPRFPRRGMITPIRKGFFSVMTDERGYSVRFDPVSLEMSRQSLAAYSILCGKLSKRNAAKIALDKIVLNNPFIERNAAGFSSSPFSGADGVVFGFGPLRDSRLSDVFIGGFHVNPNASRDLGEAHAGLIQTDEIVNLRRFDYSGHVYDLQTKTGLIITHGGANDAHYFLSNCRCTLVRLTPEQAWLRSRNNTGLFQDDPTIAADDGWGNAPQPLDPGIRDALKDALLDLPDQLRQSAAEHLKEMLP